MHFLRKNLRYVIVTVAVVAGYYLGFTLTPTPKGRAVVPLALLFAALFWGYAIWIWVRMAKLGRLRKWHNVAMGVRLSFGIIITV